MRYPSVLAPHALAWLLTVVLLAGACAPAAAPVPTTAPAIKPTDAPKPAAAQPTTAPAAPAAKPTDPAKPAAATTVPAPTAPSGKVTVAFPVDFGVLDPALLTLTTEYSVTKSVNEGLVNRNAKGEYVPWLAESWKQVDDVTWEFKLRQGVKFQDGEPFNADAVKYNIDRLSSDAIKGRAQFPTSTFLDRVEVVDPNTVRFISKKLAATMLLELYNLGLSSPKWLKEGSLADIAKKPIGTGAYRFVEWVKDDHLTLEAWDGYWGTKPAIKTVAFRVVPEVGTRMAELETGGVDIAVDIPPDQLARVDRMSTAEVKRVATGRRVFVGFRNDSAPFTDVRVRQAINYAVNWDAIKTSLLSNSGERLSSIVVPPNNNPDVKSYPYDPETAKQLLAQAGLADGFSTVLATPAGRYIRDKDISLAIAADLAKVGIKAEVQTIEWSVFSNRILVEKNPYPMYFLGLASGFDPQSDLTNLAPNFPFNQTRWNNEEWLKLYDQLVGTPDPNQRKQISYRMQEIIHDDPPYLFLWLQYAWYGSNKKLQWTPRPDDYIYFDDMVLKS
jgi:peptide/nickel transport system substrate-binding protein